MCKYCEKNAFNILIDSERISEMIYWIANNRDVKKEDIDTINNSVVFEIRDGSGYIRLGDREDMQCLDHGEKIKINYCPMCGKELNKEEL